VTASCSFQVEDGENIVIGMDSTGLRVRNQLRPERLELAIRR